MNEYANSFYIPIHEVSINAILTTDLDNLIENWNDIDFRKDNLLSIIESCEEIIISAQNSADNINQNADDNFNKASQIMTQVFNFITNYVNLHYANQIKNGDIIDTIPAENRYRNSGKYIWFGQPEFLDYDIIDYGTVPKKCIWGPEPECIAKHPRYWQNTITHNFVNFPSKYVREYLAQNLTQIENCFRAHYNNITVSIYFDETEDYQEAKNIILNELIPFDVDDNFEDSDNTENNHYLPIIINR